MTTKLTNLFRKFHSDEEGLEALQVVMIIAIAAMIMIAAATVGQTGRHLDEDPVRQSDRQGPRERSPASRNSNHFTKSVTRWPKAGHLVLFYWPSYVGWVELPRRLTSETPCHLVGLAESTHPTSDIFRSSCNTRPIARKRLCSQDNSTCKKK